MASERVVIVGGGILGTMHALEARRRGWEVTHLEVDAGPRRASVRNFGLIWVSGRAGGPELDLDLRARKRCEDLARSVPGIGFRPVGSLTVALSADELPPMAEAASRRDAPARGFELLDAAGVRSVNPSIRGDVAGGLFCRSDAVVEPGSVLGALRTSLTSGDAYRWLPGRAGLPPPAAGSAEWGMQQLCVKRAGGGLTIGDTDADEEPFDFAVDEAPYRQLRALARAILGWELPPVVRRWSGAYTLTTDGSLYCSERVDSDVIVVTGSAGRGMTLSPAIAEQTWDEVLR